MSHTSLLRLHELRKSFSQSRFLRADSVVYAVNGVTLDLERGETLGIVGESGCGKSTLGRMAVGLLPPSGGEVFINGLPLYDAAAHKDYKAFRRGLAGVVQMVFQDPQSSLNPRMRVGESIAEPLICSAAHASGALPAAEVRERVAAMLGHVGLGEEAALRYPHEFSGGQRQRIAIARALVTRPALVVCDEPTSSLDASVQAQVLNLLQDLQKELEPAYLFISHDLGVVRHMSDRVAVMYRGMVVEEGDADELFADPLHPYTQLLLSSLPGREQRGVDSGAAVPEPGNGAVSVAPVVGEAPACPFMPRCGKAFGLCGERVPELLAVPGKGRRVRCRLFDERQTGRAEP